MTAENISMAAHISDVRVRGLRAHDQGARGALRPPEGAAPLQPRPPQVLRQATLQVQQHQLRQQLDHTGHVGAGSTHALL